MSTGQPLVRTLSPAQQQGEMGLAIYSMRGRPPVLTVLSRHHQIK